MPRRLLALLPCLALLALGPAAHAAPLTGSQYDTGDGNQADELQLDWQRAQADGKVAVAFDANDDCFAGGVKELTPNLWNFSTSLGGCTPGKSNIRVAFAHPEPTPATTLAHFAFFRNDTTGNTFLTFELNQGRTSWVNAVGRTIPCRRNGDVLLSFEVGGSSLATVLYRWVGSGGPPECPDGASGTFVSSGTIPGTRFQGNMNGAAAITNFVSPSTVGASFPANAFGEAAVNLPAVLDGIGASPCFSFVQMHVHSRSSSSISSAMIDYTAPVPVDLHSCAVTGTTYQDTNGNGARDGGEPGIPGFQVYADLDNDNTLDAGEPTATSGSGGGYKLVNVPAASFPVRQLPRSGWRCSAPASCRYDRTLMLGGNSSGNDFGNLGPSTASGTKFDDLDADGVRDPGEPGLAGFEFYADYDGDGARGAGEPSATSDATGAWTIEDVQAGTYAIREVAKAGWTCSAPSSCASAHTFASNSAVTGLTFGNWASASVSGTVYEDVDGDGGPKGSGDTDLAGRQVYVDANGNDGYDAGEPVTTTGAGGGYAFTGLRPGAYTVRVTPAGSEWYCTRPGATAATCEYALTLVSGETATGRDFGQARTASISGTAFNDADQSGTRNGSEGAWTSGATVYLDANGNGALDAGESSTTVDASGNWSFANVAARTWIVRELPGTFTCTAPSGCAFTIDLASGQASTGHAFGNFLARSLSGRVIGDVNANGVVGEPGEPGVAGWVVYVDSNTNGTRDGGEPSATTNGLGQYTITGLANGTYRARLVPQSGWTCSFPITYPCENRGSMGAATNASDTNVNFGVWAASTITGSVYEDVDADGDPQESGEGGLAGRTVYVDANGNGALDGGEKQATTGAGGGYTLTDVNPGTYTVRQVLPGGWTCTRPAPTCAYTVTVGSAAVSGRDFASHTTGSVAGTLYDDLDADGSRDGGEPGVAGRAVYLDVNGSGTLDGGDTQTTTGAGGAYAFAGLAPKAYTVRQVVPGGWTQSEPASGHTVTVSSRSAVDGRDFGSYTTGSISGRTYTDSDFDGSPYESGDALQPNRTVYLDADDDGVRDPADVAVVTDADGAFTFAGLPPGTYRVRPVAPAGWACSFPSPCVHEVTIASGATVAGTEFGSYVGGTIAGTVFEDADADGAAREAGEDGVGDRRVYLDLDGDGSRDGDEPATLTAPGGDYEFSGVIAAASLDVRLELADPWTCDSPAPCRYDVAIASGQTVGGRDFGIHATGSISGHLFTDRDADGQPQVFGENDQPQRTVFLDGDHDGEHDDGEPAATTGDSGDYTFSGLAPGDYDVRQVLPEGWTCATPDPCRWDVTLRSGAAAAGRDFSSWTTARLTGRHFEDLDADGEYAEPGEPGLPGATIELGGDAERTVTTGGDGEYAFTALQPGAYTVRAALAAGWSCSSPGPACADGFTLEAGETAQDADFGAWTTGTVSGTVVQDLGGDESAPLAGWTVTAQPAGGGSATATTTAADGTYTLTLSPGDYTIREQRPAGFGCSAPTPCEHAVAVTSRGVVTGQDFANQTTGVGGTVFEDRDGDRVRDADDPARADVTVYDDADGDGELGPGDPSTTTDVDGAYRLGGLDAGPHAIRIELPGGWLCLTTGCGYDLTLQGGDDVTGRDFALARPATIAGGAFEDADADGTRDPGDGGLANREIHLDADADGQRDGGEPLATTGADGGYAFTGLAPGTYILRQVGADGWTCSSPQPCTWEVTIESGESVVERHFLSWAAAAIAGELYDDADADGSAREDGDASLDGDVWLDLDADDVPDAGETAAADAVTGAYAFDGVRPGRYALRATLPGRTCSAPAGCERTVTVVSRQELGGRDFGGWAAAQASGTVFEDSDGDGTIGAGEPGRPLGIVWADLNGDGDADDDEPRAVAGPDGTWTIAGLKPGPVTLRLRPAGGAACSYPASCRIDRTLGSGEGAGDLDFAAAEPAQVAGTVHEDGDADGEIDAGEPPLAGATVYADRNDDGDRDAGEPSTTTDADGRYVLTGLAPGAHVVRPALPAGFTCSVPATCRRAVTAASGQAVTQTDFAGWQPASVGGRVVDDRDADGHAGAGEPGLAGQTVRLGDATATTDTAGRYAFAGLRPGGYVVRHAAPDGRRCTSPAPCERAVTLRSGQAGTGADFASHQPVSAPVPAETLIAGSVFEDRDADGAAAEPGEPALAGWTVYMDADRDGRPGAGEPATVTDAQGRYAFHGAASGHHAVRVVLPSDKWVCSLPGDCARTVALAAEGAVTGQDFAGWRKARITGHKFADADRDGSAREAGDPALPDWRVFVDLDRNGRYTAGEPDAITDAQGRYGITNVPLGRHTLREVPPAGSSYRCTYPVNACATEVTLHSGDEEATADFGSVLGIRRAVRRARIAAPTRCQDGRFAVRVRAGLARVARVAVDDRRSVSRHQPRGGVFRFRFDARRFGVGVHRLTARVTFLDGTERTVRATFYRCRSARPRFTG